MRTDQSLRSSMLSGLTEIEGDIRRVHQWSEVLSALGTGANDLDPDTAFVIGEALYAVGEALRRQFEQMHRQVVAAGEPSQCA